MGVMEQLRSGSDSTGMQVMMALVVVSFVFWYAAPSGDKSQIVAEVNGSRIMDTEFRREYRDQERYREYQYERALSNPEKQQLANDVRQQLIRDEVMLQEADRVGVQVSQAEVLLFLHDRIDPNKVRLFDDEGNWDPELYKRFLRQRQTTQSDFEHGIYEDLMRSKLQTLVYMGSSISEPQVKQAYVDDNTQIDISYVRVRPQAFHRNIDPTDDEKAAWIVENEERIKEIYERDYDRKYNHPEQLRARMIYLKVKSDGAGVAVLLPKAKKVREQLIAGADFSELAMRWSDHPTATQGGDLGLRDETKMASDIVDEVADLEVGAITEVVRADDGVRIYKLEEKKDAWVESLDEVRDQIVIQTIKEERGPELAAGFAEQLHEEWANTKTLPEDRLGEYNLIKSTTGLVKLAEPPRIGPPAEMMRDARVAAVDEVLPEVYESGGLLYVGQLSDLQSADMARYEEEKDLIREKALFERREAFVAGWVDALVAHASVNDYAAARQVQQQQQDQEEEES